MARSDWAFLRDGYDVSEQLRYSVKAFMKTGTIDQSVELVTILEGLTSRKNING